MSFIVDEKNSVTTLYVIRHAQTELNAQRKIQGSGSDPSLNESGRDQAGRLVEKITKNYSNISAVYSSDLKRAVETAEPFAEKLGLNVHTTKKLREIRWNQNIEGLVATEEVLGTELFYQWKNATVPGSETVDEVVSRMRKIMEKMHQKHPGEKVALVSSGRATSLFLKSILGQNQCPAMENCTIIPLTTSDGISFTLGTVDRL